MVLDHDFFCWITKSIVANYGQTDSFPANLPLTVTVMPTPAGNLEWTFTFSNVNGALGGHLNISANGPTILSATGGPLFKDDGRDPVGVPGFNASHTVEEGISFKGATAFAALGTTLTLSPSLLNSNSTLEFLRLVTAGVQPTTLTYAGEYGYQSARLRACWFVVVCSCSGTGVVGDGGDKSSDISGWPTVLACEEALSCGRPYQLP